MAGLAQLWSWIEEPLRQLTADHTSQPDVPWETERARLVERLGLREATDHPLVDQLVRNLDEMSVGDRDDVLSGDRLTTMAYSVAQQHAVEPAEPTTPPYDESAWNAYLATNGPYWDGTEESWAQFRDWFRYHAEEQGLGVPATGLLDFLATQAAPDRSPPSPGTASPSGHLPRPRRNPRGSTRRCWTNCSPSTPSSPRSPKPGGWH